MKKLSPKKSDIADDFNIAAWQNEVRIINRMAAKDPWLVNPKNSYLVDALHTACNASQGRSAKVLVEKYGADVNVVPNAERGMTALHEAMNSADDMTARMLIRNGADVNARVASHDGFVDGWTPLHFAVSHGHPNMIRYLVRHGADPLALNDKGQTPAEMGRASGNERANQAADLLDSLSPPQCRAKQSQHNGPKP